MALPLLLLICVCLFLLNPSMAQTYNNITLGSSLTAGDHSSSWLSISKDYAFGFQEIEPGNFLLAIWFNHIPKTITWCANRDHPVPTGAKVELTTERGLTLTDPNGLQIWQAKLVNSSDSKRLAYAAMLDTGNVVLATQPSAVL